MTSLDYNYHQMSIQFKTLDDLTDITATVSPAKSVNQTIDNQVNLIPQIVIISDQL
jgi:hypothetical protein